MAKFTIFKKPRYCRNLQTAAGFAKYAVSVGDLILYREHYVDGAYGSRLARVLGLANQLPDGSDPGKDTLVVLAVDDMLTHAYERYVKLDDVLEVRDPSESAFANFFLRGPVPQPEEAMEAIRYGAMNDRYIDKYLDPDTGGLAFRATRKREREAS